MQKISTVKTKGKKILKGQLTIGLDLGDRSSCYCVLDENGEIIREQKIPTTPEGMQQAFGKMARSRIAMETGTHSPWVSRVLTELGHEVIEQLRFRIRLFGHFFNSPIVFLDAFVQRFHLLHQRLQGFPQSRA